MVGNRGTVGSEVQGIQQVGCSKGCSRWGMGVVRCRGYNR